MKDLLGVEVTLHRVNDRRAKGEVWVPWLNLEFDFEAEVDDSPHRLLHTSSWLVDGKPIQTVNSPLGRLIFGHISFVLHEELIAFLDANK